MHRFAITALTTIAIGIAGAAHGAAQATASNTVSVRIPTVLRLRIDQSTASSARSVDFTIQDGKLDPAAVTIEVFANTSWSLTVEDRGGSGPSLQYRLNGGTWHTPRSQPLVDTGEATGGWLALPLAFRVDPGVAQVGASGQRQLLFTLTRP